MRILRKLFSHLVHPEMIYKIEEFQMSRKEFTDKIYAPFLQGLRQDCMVCIRKSIINNLPGFLMLESLLINQNPK